MMRRSAKERKDELLGELTRTRSDVISAAVSLPAEKRGEVFLGVWNVRDVIAHLIGWDYTNIRAMKDVLAGQLPQFYAHHDRDWRTYNAGLVSEYSRDNWDDLIADAAESRRQLMSYLEEIPAAEYHRDRGLRFRGWKVTIARLLQAEAEDEATHATQVIAFRDQLSGATAPFSGRT